VPNTRLKQWSGFRRQRPVVAIGALALALTVAACGGGDKKSGNATTQTTSPDVASTATSIEAAVPDAGGATSTTATPGGAATATTARSATSKAGAKSPSAITKATAPPATVRGILQVTTTASTAPSEPPQPGGSFTALLSAEGNGFDPTLSTGSIGGTDPLRLFAVYDALVYQDGKSGSIVPQVAETMTSNDALTWNLKLRPNIKFTDDTPYDAAAVKYNWDRCLDTSLVPQCSNLAMLKTWKYEAVDALTLRITLPSPNGQFPRIISIGGGGLSAIASPAALKAAGSRDSYLQQKPVGAGPFVLKEWVKDSKMVFTRNPKYWNAPRPYVDELIFRPVPDEQQRSNSFRAGEAEASYGSATMVADLQTAGQVTSVPSINTAIFLFNMKRPPFDDVNMRKAIQLVVDREEINKKIYNNVLDTANSYFPSNFPYSDPSLTLPNPDVAQAQKLVDDWIATKNGGKDLVFTLNTTVAPLSTAQGQLMQAQIQRLNRVKVNLKLQSTVQHTNDLRVSNFDFANTVYTGTDPEPSFFQVMMTGGGRGAALTGYSNTGADAAMTDSRAALDPGARNAALKKAQQLLMADVPVLIVSRGPNFWGYKANIRDIAFFDEGGLLSDRLWIKSRG
jgi:peptide/nickel transport system substrate-binding protein